MTAYLRNVQVDTVEQAAEEIRDLLVAEGWIVETGSPSSLPMVLSGKEVSSVKPYLRYTNPSGSILRLNGDHSGDAVALSIDREWTLGAGSRLWMAADDEACCIYIKPVSGNGDAYHAGALERLDPTDGWAWAVGVLQGSSFFNTYQEAQRWNSTTKWIAGTTYTGVNANVFTGTSYDSSVLLNPVIGVPILAPFWKMVSPEYRGNVKFAVSGLAGASPGSEFEQRDSVTNDLLKVYVSSGAGAFEVFSA